MGPTLKDLAIQLYEYLAGSRQVPAEPPSTEEHLHWDREERSWSTPRLA